MGLLTKESSNFNSGSTGNSKVVQMAGGLGSLHNASGNRFVPSNTAGRTNQEVPPSIKNVVQRQSANTNSPIRITEDNKNQVTTNGGAYEYGAEPTVGYSHDILSTENVPFTAAKEAEKNNFENRSLDQYNGVNAFDVNARADAFYSGGETARSEGQARVGSVYGEASGSAGITRDENGKVTGAGVGVSAKAGASAVDMSGTIYAFDKENNVGNLSASAEVSALKAEASGDAAFGIIDGKPQFGAEGEAGAYLIDASASGEAKFLGVGIKGTVSGKVGAGIEGSVGYQDGKLSLYGGAAALIGGGVGVEVDVNDLITDFDTYSGIVAGWGEDVGNAASSAWDSTSQAASNAWNATSGAVSGAASSAADFAGDAWEGAKNFTGWFD
jgi:hypothetical protein